MKCTSNLRLSLSSFSQFFVPEPAECVSVQMIGNCRIIFCILHTFRVTKVPFPVDLHRSTNAKNAFMFFRRKHLGSKWPPNGRLCVNLHSQDNVANLERALKR